MGVHAVGEALLVAEGEVFGAVGGRVGTRRLILALAQFQEDDREQQDEEVQNSIAGWKGQ